MNKRRKGISLIVLVITILVMIILAGVVIVSLQKNNPIEKAKEARFKQDASSYVDELGISIASKLSNDSSLTKENINGNTVLEVKEYVPSLKKEHENIFKIQDGELVYAGVNKNEEIWAIEIGINTIGDKLPSPKINQSLIPIKWENGKEINIAKEDKTWYNYEQKQWANAKTKDGSYYVWIPRFAYKITYYDKTITNNKPNGNIIGYSDARGIVNKQGIVDTSFSRENGVIDIVFLGNGLNKYSYIKDRKYFGNTSIVDEVNNPENYIVHPAFSPIRRNGYNKNNLPGNFGATEELDGFWVSKFEMNTNNKSEPGKKAKNNISINDVFNLGRNLNIQNYDSMNITNTQYGAVAYLSMAKGNLPAYNSDVLFTTGSNDYKLNTNQSTTKNITGVYDMNGCTWEYISAFLNNNHENLKLHAKNLVDNKNTKYVDVYRVDETNDDSNVNYLKNKDKYGDAIFETSKNGIYATGNSWYGGKSSFPMQHIITFGRNGTAFKYNDNYPGLFAFGSHYGNAEVFMGWRSVLI